MLSLDDAEPTGAATTNEEDLAVDSEDDEDDAIILSAGAHADVERIQRLIHDASENQNLRRSESSLQTFARLTGNNPWLPFSDKNDVTSQEETRVFQEMATNFNRNARRDSEKGFHKFRDCWNLEVGKRYLAKLKGDDTVVTIYRKSTEQLVDYYDKLEEQRIAATSVDSNGLQNLQQVNRVIRDSRAAIAPPVVTNVAPVVYPQHNGTGAGFTPIGAPLVMNTTAAFGSGLRPNPRPRNGSIPFLPPPCHIQVDAPRQPSSRAFLRRCRKCGRKRYEHDKKCYGLKKCNFTHCGRCGLSDQAHVRFSCEMGVLCNIPSTMARVAPAILTAFDTDVASV